VPLFVQTVQGYTPYVSGLLLMPGGLVLGLFMPISGFLSDRLNARTLVIAGLACFIVSSYLLGYVDANASFWLVSGCVVLSRIGLGLIKPSLNVTALRALRPELLGQGAGMINFARQLGGAFGVNLLSVTLDRRTFFHSDVFTSMQTAANTTTSELVRTLQILYAQAGLPAEIHTSAAMHFLGRMIQAQAYTMGFRDSFMIVAIVFTIGLIPAWVMGRSAASRPVIA
jgi:MFS family permease